MNEKRELLLEKNQLLDSLSAAAPVAGSFLISETRKEEEKEEEGEGDEPMRNSSAELIDDIMFLNEEVEVMDGHVTAMRKQLKCLNEILRSAQFEDIGERDEHQAAAELAIELVSKFTQLKDLEFQLHEFVKSLEELRKQRSDDVMDTPLQYMLQLPPLPGREEVEEKKKWIHTLPDQLTGKTNCEMRIEVFLLKESCQCAEGLRQKLAGVYSRGLVAHRPGWQQLLEELAGYDFVPLQDQWLQAEFR